MILYYIYRYMLDDKWIYVGKAYRDLDQRIYAHSVDDRFRKYPDTLIQYCEMNTKSDMDFTERLLIKTMHPIINVADKTDGSIPYIFDEHAVQWKNYYKRKPKQNKSSISTDQLQVFFESLLEQSDESRWEHVGKSRAIVTISIPINELRRQFMFDGASDSAIVTLIRRRYLFLYNNTIHMEIYRNKHDNRRIDLIYYIRITRHDDINEN